MAEVQFEGFVEEEEGIVTIAECGNRVRTRMLCETEKMLCCAMWIRNAVDFASGSQGLSA